MSTKTFRQLCAVIGCAALTLISTWAMADETRPYTQGSVVQVTSVRTKPGMFDEYMKFLAGPFRQEQEELKKLGIVTDYGIYNTDPRSPHDPDLYLVVTYKNMAVFDTLEEKSEAIEKKVYGSMKQAEKGQMDREAIREIIGTETMRELKLK